jgi:hypothetical protein
MGLTAWLQRVSNALQARRARQQADQWNIWRADDRGLHISRKGGTVVDCWAWDEIAEIVAFKRVQYVVDQICIGFRIRGADTYTCIEEENPDYERVLRLVEERFPLRAGWWGTVAVPAFETNWTTIWGESLQEEKAASKRSPA